jgi:hypothetical protein
MPVLRCRFSRKRTLQLMPMSAGFGRAGYALMVLADLAAILSYCG